MARYINTREYELANGGKKPRGFGHWAFTTNSLKEKEVFFIQGNFSEAKRKAETECNRRNLPKWDTIIVLP